MDFSLSEICDMLAEKLEKYGQKRKLEIMRAARAEKKFKTSTPLSTKVKFNFKASPIKTASPATPLYERNTSVQAYTNLNDRSALVRTRNTSVSTRNTVASARNTQVSATQTSGSARTTPQQNSRVPSTPRKNRGRFSLRPRALVFEDSDEEINGDV